MFLSRAIQQIRTAPTRTPKAASTEGGDWTLVDIRTGKMLTAGTESDTGEVMSAEGALGYHAWYRAVSLLAQKAAAVPKHLYKRAAQGKGSEEQTGHPVAALANRRANDEQTAFQFWLQMTGHVVTRGNAYAAIHREPFTNAPAQLIPMDPDKTHPVRRAGELWYVCFPFGDNAQGVKFRANEVVHFKGLGFDGLVGYPVWHVAINELGLAKGQRKLEAKRFKNSGRPALVLETDQRLNDKTKNRVRDEWERMYAGLDNAGKTAILSEGLKAKVISMTPEQLQESGAAEMSLAAISNYTGVPVSKLGGKKTYATQEGEDRSFVADGLDFYLNMEDDEFGAKLLTPEELAAGFYVTSNREALIQTDIKTKYEVLRIGTAGRAFVSPNEARDEVDLPRSDDPDADKLLTPLNMGKGGSSNQPTEPAGDSAGRPSNN